MGGLGLGISRGRGGGGAGATGRGGSSGGRTRAAQSRQIGRALAGLGGFADAVETRGLTEALRELDLGELEGRSAVEVIARVSERVAEGLDGVDGELLKTALNETILEAAQLEGELGFTDLETALQTFLTEEGLGGLVELFLTRFVSDIVTAAILGHVDQRTETEAQTEALLSGIEISCRDKARAVVERYRIEGRFNRVDWFGSAGTRLGRELADSLVVDLQTV